MNNMDDNKRSLNSQPEDEQLNQIIDSMLRTREDARGSLGGEFAPLVRIAAELRHLPRENFKKQLKAKLERSISMTITAEAPVQTRTFAAPRITFKNAAKAMEFYKNAFGAKETFRFENEGGMGHAEMMIGDSVIMFTEEWPDGNRYSAETLGNSPILMEVEVPDVDSFVKCAVSAGAKLLMPPKDEFYGYRVATLLDPFGYKWGIHTVKEELSLEAMHQRFSEAMPAEKKPETPRVSPVPEGYRTVTPYMIAEDADGLVNFVKQAFGAEEMFRTIGGAGGLHCEVKIGDSMVMIGGGIRGKDFKGTPNTTAIHLYVEDCDAAYERALKAGATSIDAPVNQDYGERSATVKDAADNFWYIATHQGESYMPKGLHNVNVYLHPLRAEPVIRFLQQAFGAKEIAKYVSPVGEVNHAEIQVGDSVIEMGESHGKYLPMKSMFYLYVPNCDIVYRKALAAGATSLSEPKDQSYGDRSAGVADVFGNQWYIATHIKDVTM